jgi:hypothetical protein
MNLLVKQFLAEEAGPSVQKLIVDAVGECREKSDEVQKRFEFNRFEITIDFLKSTVLIEDVLDSGASGETSLPLDKFLLLLADKGEQTEGL